MNSLNSMHTQTKEQDIAKATQRELSQTQSEFWQMDADLSQMTSRMNLGQRREFQDVAKKFVEKMKK